MMARWLTALCFGLALVFGVMRIVNLAHGEFVTLGAFTLAFVQGLGGSVLACDHTRRNTPEVLAAVNEVFDAAQRHGEFTGFRRHTTEIAAVVLAAKALGVYATRKDNATAAVRVLGTLVSIGWALYCFAVAVLVGFRLA